jgi:hypothetical protein
LEIITSFSTLNGGGCNGFSPLRFESDDIIISSSEYDDSIRNKTLKIDNKNSTCHSVGTFNPSPLIIKIKECE